MRKLKARMDYSKLRNSELAVLAGKVSEGLTDNPNFITSNVLIDTFKEAAADYIAKLQISTRGGSTHDIDLKEESRIKLLDAFREVSQMVSSVARGSASIISSSGLIPWKQASALTIPDVIVLVRMGDGAVSGEISITFQADQAATQYLVELGTVVAGTETISWGQTYSARSSRKFIIGSLEPGTRYYARVRGHNPVGDGDWSEPVSLIAR